MNARVGTEIERMKYFSSFISNYDSSFLLDLGCGKGLLFDNLASSDESELVGVDLIKNRKQTYHHVVGSATRLPFKNNSFSLVTAFSILEHIPEAERKTFYSEAKRVLRGEGIFLIQLPNRYAIIESHSYLPFFGFLPSRMHSFAYREGYTAVPSIKNVVHFLENSGFEIFDVKKYEAPFLPFGYFLGKIGLFQVFPMGYVISTRLTKRKPSTATTVD